MLEYRNITKKFGNKEAVKELTLNLKKGTIYGLLGENGSGKTTLMKMAAGLTQPTEGEILFEGHPLSYQDKASIANIMQISLRILTESSLEKQLNAWA